jgi:hypothetical protein
MKTKYLESVRKQFAYYKMLGEKTFAQVPDEKLFRQYNDDIAHFTDEFLNPKDEEK